MLTRNKLSYDTSGTGYEGRTNYMLKKPLAAPLRVASLVWPGPSIDRQGNQNLDATNIYGPMEAGFSSQQFRVSEIKPYQGVDTKLAEQMVWQSIRCETKRLPF